MNSKNTKSSEELQNEVHQDINRVNDDIDEMKYRMSPGQIIDDAIFYPHRGNPRETFNHLKRNPIGSTFLAIGTMLLMEDERHRSYETVTTQKMGEMANLTRGKMNEGMASARGRVDHLKEDINSAKNRVSEARDNLAQSLDNVKSKVSAASYRVSGKVENLSQKLSSTVDSATSKVKAATDNIGEKVSDTTSSAGYSFDEVKEDFTSSVEEAKASAGRMNPLAYMAIGAGLGALSGAALPVPEKERQLVDDKLGDKMGAFKQELQSAMSESFSSMKSDFMSQVMDFDFNKLKSRLNRPESSTSQSV